MKKEQLIQIIQEEIAKEMASNNSEVINEIYDLEQVKYSPALQKQVDNFIKALEKSPNLSKTAIASILNDIILALGLNKTQITMYMNMIKQARRKYEF